mmetsp:Transcript_70326/g.205686  ORF Transcript_70326/g.205686 Transcript_70326/m.205686 type:complete len:336 (-) Transcript_70326:965-1972(-)
MPQVRALRALGLRRGRPPVPALVAAGRGGGGGAGRWRAARGACQVPGLRLPGGRARWPWRMDGGGEPARGDAQGAAPAPGPQVHQRLHAHGEAAQGHGAAGPEAHAAARRGAPLGRHRRGLLPHHRRFLRSEARRSRPEPRFHGQSGGRARGPQQRLCLGDLPHDRDSPCLPPPALRELCQADARTPRACGRGHWQEALALLYGGCRLAGPPHRLQVLPLLRPQRGGRRRKRLQPYGWAWEKETAWSFENKAAQLRGEVQARDRKKAQKLPDESLVFGLQKESGLPPRQRGGHRALRRRRPLFPCIPLVHAQEPPAPRLQARQPSGQQTRQKSKP